MDIQNAFPGQPLTRTAEHRHIGRAGEIYLQSEPILTEHAVSVCINGAVQMDFVCLPEFLPELILGHLVTDRKSVV